MPDSRTMGLIELPKLRIESIRAGLDEDAVATTVAAAAAVAVVAPFSRAASSAAKATRLPLLLALRPRKLSVLG